MPAPFTIVPGEWLLGSRMNPPHGSEVLVAAITVGQCGSNQIIRARLMGQIRLACSRPGLLGPSLPIGARIGKLCFASRLLGPASWRAGGELAPKNLSR